MRLRPCFSALSGIVFLLLARHSSCRAVSSDEAIVPSKDSFYEVPPKVADFKPGHIFRHRIPDATYQAFFHKTNFIKEAHQLLYRTADNHDDATATVLTVLVPENANMSRVLSYSVAEDAASIDCAPSFGFQAAVEEHKLLTSATMQLQLLLIEAVLQRGWVVIIPDFQGPMAAYAANRLASHGVLDGIRAALQSKDTTGIEPDADVIIWGYSGGAAVTQLAVDMQPIYAPELKLTGAAVGGIGNPDASLDDFLAFNEDARTGLLVAALVGLSSQYEPLKKVIDDELKPEHREKFYTSLDQCIEANLAAFFNKDIEPWFSDFDAVLNHPIWKKIISDNTRNTTTPTTPMLWYQSTRDEIVHISVIDKSWKDYCDRGAKIDYIKDTAPNLLHRNYGVVGVGDALTWIEARFDRKEDGSECSKKTTYTTNADPDFLKLFPDDIQKSLAVLINAPKDDQ
ncbi:LIP-domain-containing protein [Sarocladium strictum]